MLTADKFFWSSGVHGSTVDEPKDGINLNSSLIAGPQGELQEVIRNAGSPE